MFKRLITVHFNKRIKNRFFCSKFLSEEKLRNVLLTNLHVEPREIDQLFNLYSERLLKISEKRIIRNCQICNEHNVELKTARNIFTCFVMYSHLLKHRIFVLQELGVPKIDINLVWRLAHYMRRPASEFKTITKIPEEQHIINNIINHIDGNLSNVLPIEKLNESVSTKEHYKACFSYYAQHKLGAKNDEPLKYKGFMFKSIRIMTKLIDFYRDKFGFDLEYIRNHLHILDVCPDYAQYVMDNLKDYKISDYNFQEVVKKWYKILHYDPENTKKVLLTLKKYELDGKPLRYCIKILKVDNDYLIDKLNELSTTPDIRVWFKSQRILFFIVHKNTINKRIELLRKRGYIKSANSHLITSDNSFFKKFLQDEVSCSVKGTYIVYILCKELGSDKEDLINILKKHPYWNKVSFVDIDDTLRNIKEYYSIEDICRNIHIILYPWATIKKTLQTINESDTFCKEYTLSQQLALCLYLMEKNNHFTGDAIWNIEDNNELTSNKEMESLDNNEFLDLNQSFNILNKS
ncbi:hypothetical protein M0804_007522 [Polistes exclamans]|nr:hypothetical protein M0804_007522 [Polistes exclamans]